MVQLDLSVPFDLDFTLCCGQTFRWKKKDDWWYGTVGENVFKVRQSGDKLEFENASEDFVRRYFGLNDNLPEIFSQINKDKHIGKAIEEFKGLRILRQDPWECLISYICATYKNIAAIERMLLCLSRKFGKEVVLDGYSFFTFPTPMKLAKATSRNLRECELGYRAKYVSETSKEIFKNDYELEHLRKATYDQAKEELLRFPGVGPKVADCVLLFSLEKLDAFPVDVWIRRAVLRHYASSFPSEFVDTISRQKSLSESGYKQLNLFGRHYFGKYAGYAQEYLYHYERTQGRSHS
ncbi:MAG: DNA glycosylase [Candidatus Bathyarchaeia archaeon]